MENKKTDIAIIVAMADNRAIGYKNRLLFRIPEDMKRFRRLTMGNTVIMGRKTYESLPNGALPGRQNIVVSQTLCRLDDAEVCRSLYDALHAARGFRVFVIGGESIYRQALPLADVLYLTVVHQSPTEADAFFPETVGWETVSIEKHDEYDFLVLCNKNQIL